MSDNVIKKAMLFLKDRKGFEGYVDRGAEFGVTKGFFADKDSARRHFLQDECNDILDEYDDLSEIIANTKNDANAENKGARELGRDASVKRLVLLRYKQLVVEELKKAILKEKQKERAAGIVNEEEVWEQDRDDFYEEREREALGERSKRDRKYEIEKDEEKEDEEDNKELEESGLSAADIETAKIAARELIYNEHIFESVDFLHDEGYERSAKQAALMSKNFLNDLDKGKQNPDKRVQAKGIDGKKAAEKKPDKKMQLFPAKKNEFYGPGVLSVGQKTAVMVLSSSMAVVYKTQDVAKAFPPGTAVEIKTMRVDENKQVEAYTRDRSEKIRWVHGRPC